MAMQQLYPSSAPPEPASSGWRPLCWWTSGQLEEAAKALGQMWKTWLEQWLGPDAASAASGSCRVAWEDKSGDATWRPLGANEEAIAWIDSGAELGETLLPHLYGVNTSVPPAGSIAQAVAREAWRDLTQALIARLRVARVETGSVPVDVMRPWSGAVVATLRIGENVALRLLLNHECVAALVPAQPTHMHKTSAPLAPIEVAFEGQNVKVSAALEPCELDLGTLASLQVGDVVPFPHALEAPFKVQVDGAPLCAGYLGKLGRSRAIELVPDTLNATAVTTDKT